MLRALQWATKNRIERLDIPLIRMGLTDKLLKDSRNHLIIDYDIYKHPQTKEYILRIRTESEGNTHSIDLEHCIRLLFQCGLRIGELLALQWDEIEFIDDCKAKIHINASWGKTTKGMARKEPKTASSKRTIPVNDSYKLS